MRELVALADRFKERLEREDWRMGMVAAVIANVNRNPRKRPRAYKPQDFMPATQKPRPVQQRPGFTPQMNEMMAWAMSMGAVTVVRPKHHDN